MDLDAASGGTFRPDRVALRAASGDGVGGSDFADLARGVEAIGGGLLRSSPAGGDPLTWADLRSRLAAGGSALVAGSDSALPAGAQPLGPRLRRPGTGRLGSRGLHQRL